jgi:hypothetical protein
MAKRISPDLKTDRPTHTTDFIQTDVDHVRFYENPMTDNIVTALLALGAETWSNRRRTLVLERLLEDKGVTQEMVESYMPTAEDNAAWELERNQFVETVMSPLMREANLPPSTDWQDED